MKPEALKALATLVGKTIDGAGYDSTDDAIVVSCTDGVVMRLIPYEASNLHIVHTVEVMDPRTPYGYRRG